ncbi:MAG: hypothetical protein HY717_05650 [Planctomycetes bacterium]|nr:hypothetical protein [Planctomycetota bacterium]
MYQTSERAQGKASGWWKWLTLVVVLAYTASWIPALFFYLEFQRLITSYDLKSPHGSLVNASIKFVNAEEKAAAASPAFSAGGWNQVVWGGALLTLPPGEVKDIRQEEGTLAVAYENGKLLVDRFPPGFIRNLFFEEFQRLGEKVEKLPRAFLALPESELLVQIAGATPREFRFGMPAQERTLYATKILTKLLLWDLEQVEEGLVLAGKNTKGALMRGAGGEAKAIIPTPGGVFVISLLKDFPGGWQEGKELLLEILPAQEDLVKVWQGQVKERYPETHPIRRWAFEGDRAESKR